MIAWGENKANRVEKFLLEKLEAEVKIIKHGLSKDGKEILEHAVQISRSLRIRSVENAEISVTFSREQSERILDRQTE